MKKIIVCGDYIKNHTNTYDMVLKNNQYTQLLKYNIFPLLIPPIQLQDEEYADLLKDAAGLLFLWGKDVDPKWYNEDVLYHIQRYPTKDSIEFALFDQAIKLHKPIFWICRWLQVINVALWWSLYQDIKEQKKSSLTHYQNTDDFHSLCHTVSLAQDSFLFSLFQENQIRTNSFHHQAIKTLWSWLVSVAESSDSIIEAIQHTSYPICAVQRHPEIWTDYSSHSQQLLSWVFQKFYN